MTYHNVKNKLPLFAFESYLNKIKDDLVQSMSDNYM